MKRKMKTTLFVGFIAMVSVSVLLASCGSQKNSDSDQTEKCFCDNPIDSIVHNTDTYNLFDNVYGYLNSHLNSPFTNDSIGYHYYACNDWERTLLWKDCGEVRVYSIPWESIHSSLGYNIVQLKGKDGKSKLDTTFLNENVGRMDNLLKLTNRTGKTYYILKTSIFTLHQGASKRESVSAFSAENGKLVREKLFHAKSKQYDIIEVACGGQRELPLDYNYMDLICLGNFDADDDGVPVVVIAEINENDWPTGYGLKYHWNGDWFEYVGKCFYDANELVCDY